MTNEAVVRNEYPLVITIDGPAGAGKSTVARLLAARLGFVLLDSGALYRAMALHLSRLGIDPDCNSVPEEALISVQISVEPRPGAMKVFLGLEDVGEIIRDDRISSAASRFSARAEVRRALIGIQRGAAARGSVVAEGRDMGTVVFPDATVKFFLTADARERAGRRYKELLDRGAEADYSNVLEEMKARDHRDESRPEAPLAIAADALVIDTTELKPDEVVELMIAHIVEKAPVNLSE